MNLHLVKTLLAPTTLKWIAVQHQHYSTSTSSNLQQTPHGTAHIMFLHINPMFSCHRVTPCQHPCLVRIHLKSTATTRGTAVLLLCTDCCTGTVVCKHCNSVNESKYLIFGLSNTRKHTSPPYLLGFITTRKRAMPVKYGTDLESRNETHISNFKVVQNNEHFVRSIVRSTTDFMSPPPDT